MQSCSDISEAVELFKPQCLYLKPIAKLSICVQLPQLKTAGKSISNWEVMEKIKNMIKPDQFIVLKISKSNLEFLRFEGETESRAVLKTLIARLDGKTIKLGGFPELLKVRAAEAKLNFPTRHDWDSYFRDAKNMNEMKTGERPDTIHFQNLPSKWFANKKDKDQEKPSEYIVKKVFETFGEIKCIDIPMLDPYRRELNRLHGGIQTFSFGQDLLFEAYILYKEYIGFVKAMNAFRGMKLLYKEDDKAATADIKVDFDKTKHLSDKNINKRMMEAQHLKELEWQKQEKLRKDKEEEERLKLKEEIEKEKKYEDKVFKKERRHRERSEQHNKKKLKKRRLAKLERLQIEQAKQKRALLIEQRKESSLNLLKELFQLIQVEKQTVRKQLQQLKEERKREMEKEKLKKEKKEKEKIAEKHRYELELKEKQMRERLIKKWHVLVTKQQEDQRENLRKKVSGKVRLKSVLVTK